jgi:hypothetical protein
MFNTVIQFIKTNVSFLFTLINKNKLITTTEETITKIGDPMKKIKKIKENLKDSTKKEKKNIEEDIKKIKQSKWQTYVPFTFFYGNNKFQPLYFWIFIFCTLASAMLFVKIYAAGLAVKKGTFTSEMISTADLGVVLGFVSSLVLLYNNNKKNNIKETSI